jgi:hypothetical protein
MVNNGAPRMSSISRLKVTPSTLIVLPFADPPQRSTILSIIRRFTADVHGDHRLHDVDGCRVLLSNAGERRGVFGEAGVAVARSRVQALVADPPVEAQALGHRLDVGADLLAERRGASSTWPPSSAARVALRARDDAWILSVEMSLAPR